MRCQISSRTPLYCLRNQYTISDKSKFPHSVAERRFVVGLAFFTGAAERESDRFLHGAGGHGGQWQSLVRALQVAARHNRITKAQSRRFVQPLAFTAAEPHAIGRLAASPSMTRTLSCCICWFLSAALCKLRRRQAVYSASAPC